MLSNRKLNSHVWQFHQFSLVRFHANDIERQTTLSRRPFLASALFHDVRIIPLWFVSLLLLSEQDDTCGQLVTPTCKSNIGKAFVKNIHAYDTDE